MSDEQESALEADQIVVSDEDETTEPEAAENTTGQDETPPAEDEGEALEAEEDKPSESKLRRERRKATITRLVNEAKEAKAEADAANAELARIEQESQSSIPPKESDFDTYEEYQAALSGFHSLKMHDDRERKKVSAKADAQKQRMTAAEEARQYELKSNWMAQRAEAPKKYADFEAVFTDDLPVTAVTAEILADSDVGVDIAYHLGTHRREAELIAALPPLEQARRLGMIEAKLSAPKANKIPNTPDPITPVRGKATTTKSPDNMTMDEYVAARRAGKLK